MAESAAIVAVGSRLKIEPPSLCQAWPPGLQYATSVDSSSWGSWADAEYYQAVTITYPGYYKLKTTSAAMPKVYNFKTAIEADSTILDTVIIGTHEH